MIKKHGECSQIIIFFSMPNCWLKRMFLFFFFLILRSWAQRSHLSGRAGGAAASRPLHDGVTPCGGGCAGLPGVSCDRGSLLQEEARRTGGFKAPLQRSRRPAVATVRDSWLSRGGAGRGRGGGTNPSSSAPGGTASVVARNHTSAHKEDLWNFRKQAAGL